MEVSLSAQESSRVLRSFLAEQQLIRHSPPPLGAHPFPVCQLASILDIPLPKFPSLPSACNSCRSCCTRTRQSVKKQQDSLPAPGLFGESTESEPYHGRDVDGQP
ncbi:hypothetical protein J3459_007771 [Metarhizium acridum]|uniref:uncharacterized protein n=1 Tax=Metarhizium acridum TaxID=92637 RepID=UPI001C6B4A92|nr:hypothetical protein J3458_019132 [Metarhizium acridum]KAG8426830.1 hypothetical protein J3459_007771 [Metarhizium acridum]